MRSIKLSYLLTYLLTQWPWPLPWPWRPLTLALGLALKMLASISSPSRSLTSQASCQHPLVWRMNLLGPITNTRLHHWCRNFLLSNCSSRTVHEDKQTDSEVLTRQSCELQRNSIVSVQRKIWRQYISGDKHSARAFLGLLMKHETDCILTSHHITFLS